MDVPPTPKNQTVNLYFQTEEVRLCSCFHLWQKKKIILFLSADNTKQTILFLCSILFYKYNLKSGDLSYFLVSVVCWLCYLKKKKLPCYHSSGEFKHLNCTVYDLRPFIKEMCHYVFLSSDVFWLSHVPYPQTSWDLLRLPDLLRLK